MAEEFRNSSSEAQLTLKQLSTNSAIRILPPKPKNDFIASRLFKERDHKGTGGESKGEPSSSDCSLKKLNKEYLAITSSSVMRTFSAYDRRKGNNNAVLMKAESESKPIYKESAVTTAVQNMQKITQTTITSKENVVSVVGRTVVSVEETPVRSNSKSPRAHLNHNPFSVGKYKTNDHGRDIRKCMNIRERSDLQLSSDAMESEDYDDDGHYDDADPNLEGSNSSDSMDGSDFDEGTSLPEGTSLTSVSDKHSGLMIKSRSIPAKPSSQFILKKQPVPKALVFTNSGSACLTQGNSANFSLDDSAVNNPLTKLANQKSLTVQKLGPSLTMSTVPIPMSNNMTRPLLTNAKGGLIPFSRAKFSSVRGMVEGKAIRVVKPNVTKLMNPASKISRSLKPSTIVRDESRDDNFSESTVCATSDDAFYNEKVSTDEGLISKFCDSRFYYEEGHRPPHLKMYRNRSPRQKLPDEPECLTLSSDEDDKHDMANCSSERAFMDESDEETSRGGDEESETCGDKYALLQCRTVRIGSYRAAPIEKAIVNDKGIHMIVPPVDDSMDPVPLLIPMSSMQRILVHYGPSIPVIFINSAPSFANEVRKALGMTDKRGPYFDPVSNEDNQKRITILPDMLDEEDKNTINSIFKKFKNFQVISQKDANEILIRSSPTSAQDSTGKTVKEKVAPEPPEPPKPVTRSQAQDYDFMRDEIYTILMWPPLPSKGGIAITTDDYCCLEQEQFLNDVIVDFYLKYLLLAKLSPEDRQKTHIFSSYFYQRLTLKPNKARRPNAWENDPKLSPAEKRHARVKTWTKNVDIFEKDYIIIPINEHSHWFLAIVCFPGLKGPVNMKDGKSLPSVAEKKSVLSKPSKSSATKMEFMQIGSTTITAIKPASSSDTLASPKVATVVPSPVAKPTPPPASLDHSILEDDWSDRDEAEGDEDEVLSEGEDSDNIPEKDTESLNESEPSTSETKDSEEVKPDKSDDTKIKQPSILIFDSLAGSSRSRIVATLRDYLQVEYKRKRGEERLFNKDTIKGQVPKVPQQNNFSDCGLYMLQYAESFFENPISDYKWPIKTLREWFPEERVANKRQEIQKLIIKLMNEQNPHLLSKLPELQFDSNRPSKPMPNLVPLLSTNKEFLTVSKLPVGQIGNRPVQTVRPIHNNMKLDYDLRDRILTREELARIHLARSLPRGLMQSNVISFDPTSAEDFSEEGDYDDDLLDDEEEEEEEEDFNDMGMEDMDEDGLCSNDRPLNDDEEDEELEGDNSIEESSSLLQFQSQSKAQAVESTYSTDEVKKMLQGRHVTMECVPTNKRPHVEDDHEKSKKPKEG